MPVSDDFAAHCAELLAVAGPVRSRRMFGGHGFYVHNLFVALVVGDMLYLKSDSLHREWFERAGGARFEFVRQGRTQAAGFWTVPAEALESPASMRPWVQRALDAALRARARTMRP